MRSPCCVCSSGDQAEGVTNRLSAVPHTSVYGQEQIQASQGVALMESAQHLAVISEAMLRLGNLLRTDHMLGGSQSDTFFKSLHHVLEELSDEWENNEP